MKKIVFILLFILLVAGCTTQETGPLGSLGELSDPNIKGVSSVGGVLSNPFSDQPDISVNSTS